MTPASSPLPTTMPSLRGRSVVLRSFRDADADVVREASSDPFIPAITTVPTSSDDVEVLAFIRRQHSRLPEGEGYSFAIADASATGDCLCLESLGSSCTPSRGTRGPGGWPSL